ncbi:endolytic transglycosylase MltG [Priestia taiwanensis]|uniref:Endolytic murein transglycosylase n=1 Tax=Priestia taiwanensis TaxID=1347902 RepID=A0A917AU58_9BACI|nr:endolytic transglycosylase MltG [Priestia taiwanensis]MBM7363687.1 UPF0755 protein [Priestia taiwanensis]GGE74942.1 hypothetical protein GCM10007140_26000 [Priestia taiwanensis]
MKQKNVGVDRQKEAKTVRKIVFMITSVIIGLLLVVGISAFLYINNSLKPVNADATEMIDFKVKSGEGTTTIGEKLEKEGFIHSAKIFKYYVKLKNSADFKAGTVELSKSMTLEEIVGELNGTNVKQTANFELTIPEGQQLEQIAQLIAEKFGLKEKEILAKLDDKEYVKQLQKEFPTILTDKILDKNIKHPLEGYLFPAKYEYIEEKPTLDQIIKPMLKKTEEVLAKYEEQMKAKNMDVHTLVTMSSLIEEEATQQADRKQIASVFYNRLEKGMKLQTDPTVLYALGEHKSRVLYEHLEVQSPYNTYYIKGLPVGPIANAGEESIKAALEPAETNYLYFLAAKKDGKVYFAETFEEHKELKRQHIDNVQ